MVNFVIVSHSEQLAQGVLQLAQQMADDNIKIALAAGIDDPDNPIGTDAVKIYQAIEEVFSPEGVIIFVDLGSAILSAETALELLEPEMAEKVVICSAPLVEGMISAVVAASAGETLEGILAEANQALTAKKAQLAVQETATDTIESAVEINENSLVADCIVYNQNGLHARPAALLAKTLAKFDCDLVLVKNEQKINPKTLNQIVQLQVRKDDLITLYATGKEAQLAITAFQQLAQQHFGEQVSSDNNLIYATAVLQDQLEGVAYVWQNKIEQALEQTKITDIQAEQQRLHYAIIQVKQQLHCFAQLLNEQNTDLAEIFNAHLLMLEDEELYQGACQRIVQQQCNAQWAWQQEMALLREQYLVLSDPYLQARELDIRDLSQQVIAILTQKSTDLPKLDKLSILCCEDLTPSQFIQLDRNLLQGICLQKGNHLSHTALLAKGLNVPMMVNLDEQFAQIKSSQVIKLDLLKGVIYL